MTDKEIEELNDQLLKNVLAMKARADEGITAVAEMKARVQELETVLARGETFGAGRMAHKDVKNSPAYKALGEWMVTGHLPQEYKAALQSGVGPDGGFMLTEELSTEIERKERDISPVRSIARIVPAKTADGKFLMDAGGIESGWVGETTSRPETDTSTLEGVSIPLFEIYANPKATQNQLDDAPQSAEWLTTSIAEEFQVQEGAAYVTGNGVTRPRGFTTYDTSSSPDSSRAAFTHQYVATGTSGAFYSAAPADVFFDVVRSLKPGFRRNAVWTMNSETQADIAKLKDGEGRFLLVPDFSSGDLVERLLGKPVVILEDMASIGANSLSVAFGDFKRGYIIRDHVKGSVVLRDPFTAKPHVHFYTTKRTGGGCYNFSAIKFLKFSAS
jgi:HK97 family phage major capsid protein